MASQKKVENKKVLIAMDGSKHAEFALKYFKENCHEDGDEVTLLFVSDYGHIARQPLFTADPQLVSRLATEEQKEMDHIVEKLSELTAQIGLKAQVIRTGANNNPGEAIVQWAKDNKVDMVVTGTRGQGKLRRTLMGSVSQYIVHHAHVPVLVCPHKQAKA